MDDSVFYETTETTDHDPAEEVQREVRRLVGKIIERALSRMSLNSTIYLDMHRREI